jgi:hypothetical protein
MRIQALNFPNFIGYFLPMDVDQIHLEHVQTHPSLGSLPGPSSHSNHLTLPQNFKPDQPLEEPCGADARPHSAPLTSLPNPIPPPTPNIVSPRLPSIPPTSLMDVDQPSLTSNGILYCDPDPAESPEDHEMDDPIIDDNQALDYEMTDDIVQSEDDAPPSASANAITDASVTISDIRDRLLAYGVDVHVVHNWIICIDCGTTHSLQDIYGHRRNAHPAHPSSKKQLPLKSNFQKMLRTLNAHSPAPVPATPIPRIHTLPVILALCCTMVDCSLLFPTQKRLSEHYRKLHPDIISSQRSYRLVPAHRLFTFRRHICYVEVIDAPNSNDDSDKNLADIIANFEHIQLARKSNIYKMGPNPKARTPFLFKTNWDQPLVGVDIAKLRATVLPANPVNEPNLFRLKDIARAYYDQAASAIYKLSILTRRYIHSQDPKYVPELTSTQNLLKTVVTQPVTARTSKLVPFNDHKREKQYTKIPISLSSSSSGLSALRTHPFLISLFICTPKHLKSFSSLNMPCNITPLMRRCLCITSSSPSSRNPAPNSLPMNLMIPCCGS